MAALAVSLTCRLQKYKKSVSYLLEEFYLLGLFKFKRKSVCRFKVEGVQLAV
jgi:hypothetical protein